MIITIIQLAILLLVPVIIHNLLRDRAISRWVSPVVACLGIGIALGSLLIPNLNIEDSQSILDLSERLQGVSIIIAIPLLLMTSNFMKWLPKAKGILKAFCASWVSVLIGTVVTFFIYKGFTNDGCPVPIVKKYAFLIPRIVWIHQRVKAMQCENQVPISLFFPSVFFV